MVNIGGKNLKNKSKYLPSTIIAVLSAFNLVYINLTYIKY
jgi:hypothetical protein